MSLWLLWGRQARVTVFAERDHEVPAVKHKEMVRETTGESSETEHRTRRASAEPRFAGRNGTGCNSKMTPKQIKEHCRLDEESQELLKMAKTELDLSARAYDRIL